ncbi:MAG TPA: SDR family oxidoreductase [Salinimicrobium sp.]|nr:SDR family oxidoreductase [Salinimicrobium sp.]
MILVTGGTGLVGSHLLVELLKSGKNVRAIFRNEKKLDSVKRVFFYYFPKTEAEFFFEKIDWVKAEINDIPSLEIAFPDVTQVFHCAALVSFDPSDNKKLRKINIEGTANVVNLCISNKVEKLCLVSSIATLDLKPGEEEISEISIWNPAENHSMYAITKYGAEMEAWRASQEGIPVVIVNPGVIIGPGFWESGSGKIFKKVKNGLNFYFPKITGFVGVKDVVKIMAELMERPVKNEQFILVAENVSFKHIFEQVAVVLGKSPPSKALKPWMLNLGWIFQKIFGFATNKPRNLTSQSRKSLFKSTFYSSEKIKILLDYEFKKIDDVISETAENFKRDLEKQNPRSKQDKE